MPRPHLPLLALVATVAAIGCKTPQRDESSASDRDPIASSTARAAPAGDAGTPGATGGTYRPASGLLELHFPTDFEARADGTNQTFVVPKAGVQSVSAPCIRDCLVAMTTLEGGPDVESLADKLQKSRANVLPEYALVSRTKSECFKGNPGVEVVWTHMVGRRKLRSRACVFVKDGKGYSFVYGLPEAAPASDLEALQRIVDGTVLL